MNRNLIELAERIARKSQIKTKVAAILIDKGGKIIAHGHNYRGKGRYLLGHWTVHAEVSALSRVRKPSPNLSMLIYRAGNKPIDPCASCKAIINAYQIKAIYLSGKL